MDITEVEQNIIPAASLLKCLSHRGRLQVMCALHKGEKNVGSLEKITNLSQSALSQHLALLRDKGLVKTRRDAQTIFYSINNDAAEAVLHCLWKIYATEDGQCCGGNLPLQD